MTYNDYTQFVNKLIQYNHEYHVLDKPTIPDEEYDKLYRDLIMMESKHPDWVRSDSPSQRVGGKILDGFTKVTRDKPMLSLDNVFTQDELMNWLRLRLDKLRPIVSSYGIENVEEYLRNLRFTVEPKLDGLAISLIYVDGKLHQAVTRGDGLIGEDVTENVKTIKQIPITLPTDFTHGNTEYKGLSYLEVRGEIYMCKSDFVKVNQTLAEQGDEVLKHPRNAAAGAIRNLDTSITASRKLSFSAYTLADIQFTDKQYREQFDKHVYSHLERLYLLRELGFHVHSSEFSPCRAGYEQIWDVIETFRQKRSEADTPIDGAVIKVDAIYHQEELGENVRVPEWAIAYKYPAVEMVTTLNGITYQVGRSGVLTPVGEISPVLIDGVEVSRVTFHNPTFLKQSGVSIGDDIAIIRSGDVIPKFQRIVNKRSDIELPSITHCPCCQTPVVYADKLVYCPNKQCTEQLVQRLTYFVSRDVMNIMYFGEEYIRWFVLNGILKSPIDIYLLNTLTLQKHPDIKDGESTRLLKSISDSKTTTLTRVITACMIPTIGVNKAQKIAGLVKLFDLKTVLNDTEKVKQLTSLIGNVSTTNVINWFDNVDNVDYFNNLLSILSLSTDDISVVTDTDAPLYNKRLVVTGTFGWLNRQDVFSLITSLGGVIANSVSKNTDYLVVGDNAGSKLAKANQLGIPTLSINDIIEMHQNYKPILSK